MANDGQHALDSVLVKVSGTHTHAHESRDLMRRTAIAAMKDEVVARADKSCRQVYQEVLASRISDLQPQYPVEEIGAVMPTFSNVRSALQRHRSHTRPALPKTLAEIDLEGPWTRTEVGENFLVVDDGSNNRMLGFCTEETLKILCEVSCVFMDGTFKVVPSLFSQLYSLHGFFKGQMMPLAYFLLPNKEAVTYVRMFRLLEQHASTKGFVFRPAKFHLDFEVSALKAVEECFPAAEMKGCAFHYTQAVWRSVQRNGLTTAFHDDPIVKCFIKSLMALCLVPLSQVDDAWLQVDADSPPAHHEAHEQLNLFKEYFIRTWLESPTYPRSLWNHHGNFGSRTTNHLEGWHNALTKKIRSPHVSIFEMINHLKRDEHDFKIQRILLNAGNQAKLMIKKYRVLNDRLARLTTQLERGVITLMEYVRFAAFNLHDPSP